MAILVISFSVGYMLKVLKSGKEITEFKEEFALIRHGNYIEFIKLIGGEIGYLVVYNNGVITHGSPPQNEDIDFELLLKAAPSLNLFYKKCSEFYGEIQEEDLEENVFYDLVLFEIGLRMHANNYNLITKSDSLNTVIEKLGKHLSMTENEIEIIQKGRMFLNMVKHKRKQFASLSEGVFAFKEAMRLLVDKKLTIM